MKYLFVFLFSIITLNTFAQLVSLNNKETTALHNLVRNDSSAKKFYASIKRTADNALTQNPNPIDTVVSEGHLATDPKK